MFSDAFRCLQVCSLVFACVPLVSLVHVILWVTVCVSTLHRDVDGQQSLTMVVPGSGHLGCLGNFQMFDHELRLGLFLLLSLFHSPKYPLSFHMMAFFIFALAIFAFIFFSFS